MNEAKRFELMEVYDGPNKAGEYHFALFWWADYHPGHPCGEYGRRLRGQHFLAPLADRERECEKVVDLRSKR